MDKRKRPDRGAWVIVAIVHVGIVLLWFSMGGCGTSTREQDDTAMPEADDVEQIDIQKDYEVTEEAVTVDDQPTVVVDDSPAVKPTVGTENEIRYVVQAGDSLWKISRTFGVTVEAIADRNDIQDATLIRAGRELWIPNPTKGFDKAATGTTETVTESTVDETMTESTTDETTVPDEPIDLSTIETFEYEVQPGDTIWKLARTYHTTTKIIMELNGISDAKTLRAGDKILIPAPPGE